MGWARPSPLPHPGLESCLAAGALAAAILLTLHAVALPLLYAFGPGETLSALLATMGLRRWCRGWPFPSTRPPSSGWPAALCPFLEQGAALFLVSLPIAVGRYARRGW